MIWDYVMGGAFVLGIVMIVATFILEKHQHEPKKTGRIIVAVFGKNNIPENIKPVESMGREAICQLCGKLLIIHDDAIGFAEAMTELEGLL